jgi:hypothetical protein
MNWSRGLFRLWLAASLLWMALWIALDWRALATDFSCRFGSNGPWCEYPSKDFYLEGGLQDPSVWEALLIPPIATLLLGLVMGWVIKGFRR